MSKDIITAMVLIEATWFKGRVVQTWIPARGTNDSDIDAQALQQHSFRYPGAITVCVIKSYEVPDEAIPFIEVLYPEIKVRDTYLVAIREYDDRENSYISTWCVENVRDGDHAIQIVIDHNRNNLDNTIDRTYIHGSPYLVPNADEYLVGWYMGQEHYVNGDRIAQNIRELGEDDDDD